MKYIKKATLIFIVMTIITGVFYPIAITAFAQIFVNNKANGSIIEANNVKIGSEIIGQNFTDPAYFWSRPSMTSEYPYNGEYSSGSNISPTGADFERLINERVDLYKQYDNGSEEKIPVDLVTASASGLDPHISLQGAKYQVNRVSKYSNISKEDLLKAIDICTEGKFLGIFGEAKVNVLKLNLEIDKLK